MEGSPESQVPNSIDLSRMPDSSKNQTDSLDPLKVGVTPQVRAAVDPIANGGFRAESGSNGSDQKQPAIETSSNGMDDPNHPGYTPSGREVTSSGVFSVAKSELSREDATQKAFEMLQEVMETTPSVNAIKSLSYEEYHALNQTEQRVRNTEYTALNTREQERSKKLLDIAAMLGLSKKIHFVEDEANELFVLRDMVDMAFGRENVTAEQYSRRTLAYLDAVLDTNATTHLREGHTPLVMVLDLRMKIISGYDLRFAIATKEARISKANIKGHVPSSIIILSGEQPSTIDQEYVKKGLAIDKRPLDPLLEEFPEVYSLGEDILARKPIMPAAIVPLLNLIITNHLMGVIRTRQAEEAPTR